jgi:hypothetical protein
MWAVTSRAATGGQIRFELNRDETMSDMRKKRKMVWRMSEAEIIKRMIIRALRRDVSKGGRGWGSYIAEIADRIERGELLIVPRAWKPIKSDVERRKILELNRDVEHH